MESLLEVDSVLKSYRQKRILTDIALDCRPGNIIGLLGRNGSGKSTFLRIVFGTLRPDSCYVRINSMINVKPYLIKGFMSYLHQDTFIPQNLTVRKAVELFLPEKAELILSDPVLLSTKDEKIKTLSGGEGRYLEIRMILDTDSQFILLDEPFNGLSPLMIDHVKELIKMRAKNAGIILTDHDYRNVLDVANRHFLLYDGGIRKIRDKEDLVRWGYLPTL